MAENNNDQAANLPKTPNPALKGFDKVIGEWEIEGPDSKGSAIYEWMEGGFFAIQKFELVQGDYHAKGVEYTGFDEDTKTLRSRLMGTDGSRLLYTYVFEGDKMYYYFGEKGAEWYSESTFSPDGTTLTGRWHMPTKEDPNAGYSYVLKRKK